MSGELTMGTGLDLANFWNTSLSFGADPSYDVERTPQTATASGVGTMQPVTQGSDNWSFFWQDALKTGMGYLIAKDAQKNDVQAPVAVPVYQQQEARRQAQSGNLLVWIVLGGMAFMALKD